MNKCSCGLQGAILLKDKSVLCISCYEKQRDKIKNEDINKIDTLAIKEQRQYLEPKEDPEKKDFEFLWESELDDYEEENKEWIIDGIIPSRSVGVWTGKRGTFKTFLILNAVFSVASEKPFLDRFPTKKGKIIYLDKENGIPIMKQRKNMIKKGLEITESVDVGFICFSTLKIDKTKDMAKLTELIEKEKPSLLIIDTYRRGISFEENDAGEVSKLFVDVLRPIVEKNNLSIILIHHDRKGESQGDEMDMIRGSSDLANYADFIMKNDRKGKNIILKQLKMRNAPEKCPVEIKIETDEESYIKFVSSGDMVLQGKDEKSAEQILLWIVKERKEQFKTKDAKDYAFRLGIKETNFKNSLNILQSKGVIEKKAKGVYEVIQGNSVIV